MGTRAWLVVLLAMTMSCEGAAIGEPGAGGTPRSVDAGTGATAGTGGSVGTGGVPGSGGVAGAGGLAGAGGVAGVGGMAGTGGTAGVGGTAGAGGAAATGGNGGSSGTQNPCEGGPLPEPIPGCSPVPPASSGDPHADCVARINQFRWECQCMPPLMRWTDGESCADANAEYDSVNGVHASFYDMPCGTGARAQNECPGWPSNDHIITGCLQAMWDEGPEDGDPDTVNGHYESMASTTYTRVACGFFTTPSGQVWGVQNFD